LTNTSLNSWIERVKSSEVSPYSDTKHLHVFIFWLYVTRYADTNERKSVFCYFVHTGMYQN